MISAATAFVVPHSPWLSQGDIFRLVPIVLAGVSKAVATASLQTGPAMLVSHGCAIDKKSKSGKSVVEYLSFLPLQSVQALERGTAGDLRGRAGELQPYNALYLGDVTDIGESYVDLTQPYTLPALLLRTELQPFTDAETGEGDDERVVATMHETRVAALTHDALKLFWRKWSIQWTRVDPFPED